MRVLIIGVGDVGTEMARILCEARNDVVVIDRNGALLEQLKDSLDVMTVTGDGSTMSCLHRAGIDQTDLLLAVTGRSEVNILACVLAKHAGVAKTIARVRRADHFDSIAEGVTAAVVGVDEQIITELECASNIIDALIHPQVKETVRLSHPDAQIVNFQIKSGSPIIGANLANFPHPEMLEQLRFCAILRYGQMIIPHGQTTFSARDELYVAGAQTMIEELIEWADPLETAVGRVIIAGATQLGFMLTDTLRPLDIRVTLIEPDERLAAQAAATLGNRTLVIQAQSTDSGALREAGIDACDAFIGLQADNESNMMSCILAKRLGAKKVIASTQNLDYMQVIAGINLIDCGFSPLIAAINALIKCVPSDRRQTAAVLKRVPAEVVEFVVDNNAPAAGKRIADLKIPNDIVLALIFRGDDLVPAIGSETIRERDRVCVLLHHNAIPQVEKLLCGPARKK